VCVCVCAYVGYGLQAVRRMVPVFVNALVAGAWPTIRRFRGAGMHVDGWIGSGTRGYARSLCITSWLPSMLITRSPAGATAACNPNHTTHTRAHIHTHPCLRQTCMRARRQTAERECVCVRACMCECVCACVLCVCMCACACACVCMCVCVRERHICSRARAPCPSCVSWSTPPPRLLRGRRPV
jgi:hypothetical protein